MQFHCGTISKQTEGGRYLIACARIRNVSVTQLVRELVTVIARDQLVLAVLDDDSSHQRNKHEHAFRDWNDSVNIAMREDGPSLL